MLHTLPLHCNVLVVSLRKRNPRRYSAHCLLPDLAFRRKPDKPVATLRRRLLLRIGERPIEIGRNSIGIARSENGIALLQPPRLVRNRNVDTNLTGIAHSRSMRDLDNKTSSLASMSKKGRTAPLVVQGWSAFFPDQS